MLGYQENFKTCKRDKYVDNNLLKYKSIKWLREIEVAFTVINRNKKTSSLRQYFVEDKRFKRQLYNCRKLLK